MHTLRLIASELFGLFVDDARLAISVVALILALAAVVRLVPDRPVLTVTLLSVGCIAILIDSTLRAARK